MCFGEQLIKCLRPHLPSRQSLEADVSHSLLFSWASDYFCFQAWGSFHVQYFKRHHVRMHFHSSLFITFFYPVLRIGMSFLCLFSKTGERDYSVISSGSCLLMIFTASTFLVLNTTILPAFEKKKVFFFPETLSEVHSSAWTSARYADFSQIAMLSHGSYFTYTIKY